jgi:Family of unknown function (DUF5317)
MILLFAVLIGLLAGLLRARVGKRVYKSFSLKGIWLVFLAYLPQFFAFNLTATRVNMPDSWIPPILISSQILLLVFVWINRTQSGFLLLGLGLLFNFLVISSNGGMMPISPETANQLIEPGTAVILKIDQRVGTGKDILLQPEDTNLSFLSDLFTLPKWIPYRLAYSIGDILISMGAFWLLWQLGGP